MKRFVLTVALLSIALPSLANAEWGLMNQGETFVTYYQTGTDVPGAIEYFVYGNNGSFWETLDSDFVQLSTDQTAVDEAYEFDSTVLPVSDESFPDGLSWPCEWSQYSAPCPTTPTTTPTVTVVTSPVVDFAAIIVVFGLTILFVKSLFNSKKR